MSEHTYRLYAMTLDGENLEYIEKERFHRATTEYILVYTNSGKPDRSVEITATEASKLSAYDKEWLRNCVMSIVMETVTSESSVTEMMGILEKVEQNLKEQSKQVVE